MSLFKSYRIASAGALLLAACSNQSGSAQNFDGGGKPAAALA